jgi:hypothetical protein
MTGCTCLWRLCLRKTKNGADADQQFGGGRICGQHNISLHVIPFITQDELNLNQSSTKYLLQFESTCPTISRCQSHVHNTNRFPTVHLHHHGQAEMLRAQRNRETKGKRHNVSSQQLLSTRNQTLPSTLSQIDSALRRQQASSSRRQHALSSRQQQTSSSIKYYATSADIKVKAGEGGLLTGQLSLSDVLLPSRYITIRSVPSSCAVSTVNST